MSKRSSDGDVPNPKKDLGPKKKSAPKKKEEEIVLFFAHDHGKSDCFKIKICDLPMLARMNVIRRLSQDRPDDPDDPDDNEKYKGPDADWLRVYIAIAIGQLTIDEVRCTNYNYLSIKEHENWLEDIQCVTQAERLTVRSFSKTNVMFFS